MAARIHPKSFERSVPGATMRYEAQSFTYEETVPLDAYDDIDFGPGIDLFDHERDETSDKTSLGNDVVPPRPISEMGGKELGAYAEDLAADYLEKHGFNIIERNYRCDAGEADIVAFDPAAEQVVLVEVKSRRGARRHADGYPEEAVTPKKQRRYHRIAACYAMDNFPVPSVRFDVVALRFTEDGLDEIAHKASAFDWDAGQ